MKEGIVNQEFIIMTINVAVKGAVYAAVSDVFEEAVIDGEDYALYEAVGDVVYIALWVIEEAVNGVVEVVEYEDVTVDDFVAVAEYEILKEAVYGSLYRALKGVVEGGPIIPPHWNNWGDL